MANITWNQSDFRQYHHSYQSPSPITPIRSFGNQGYAPFGHGAGTNPELIVPGPLVKDGPQPVYHVKVTATPIHVPENLPGGPEYVVTAFPNATGQVEGVVTKGGNSVIAHATPALSGASGVSIRPLHYDKPVSLDASGKPVLSRPGSSRLPGAASDMPAEGQETEGEALVHVYAGGQTATTQQLLHSSSPAAAGGAGVAPGAGASSGAGVAPGAGVPPGATPLERGYSRAVPRPLDLADYDAEKKAKMYSWIIPTTKGISAGAGAELSSKDGDQSDHGDEVDQIFSQASQALSGQVAAEEEEQPERVQYIPPDTQIVSTPTDDELGLPLQLRPSVLYGGVEHAPPEFAGQKGALKYKLHAIEVHQYIAMPDAEEPWIIKSKMNPATSAIFGPMPMPFDPVHSGMVAPTFQRTIGLQPTPALSPEMSRMFNHELPIISNLLDMLPEADTVE